MTTASAQALEAVLGAGGPILLDFDGPICAVFANYAAPLIADELRRVVLEAGLSLPAELITESDPLEILRWTASVRSPDLVTAVEDRLRAAEILACQTATPTPFAREVIVSARESGRPTAIVSNNSDEAIAAYLTRHRLRSYINPLVGRAYGRPDQMKPSGEPIRKALDLLSDDSPDGSASTLIGDSISDIIAARSAGVRIIAFANKPHKVDRFAALAPDAIVTSLADVAQVLSRARA